MTLLANTGGVTVSFSEIYREHVAVVVVDDKSKDIKRLIMKIMMLMMMMTWVSV